MAVDPVPPFPHPPIRAERVTGPDAADVVTLGVMHFGAVTDPRAVVDLFIESDTGTTRLVLSAESALALAAALLAFTGGGVHTEPYGVDHE